MNKVVEIFYSIEGEGKRVGRPCLFVRLHGCNLECSYCDTRYACDEDVYSEMDFDDILAELENLVPIHDCNLVTLTGGEPLLEFSSAMALVDNLCNVGYEVNVETNGSVNLNRGAFLKPDGMFYTMDLKCPSSGMMNRQQIENLAELDQNDVLKLVVSDENDILWARDVLSENPTMAEVFISPVWGRMDMPLMAKYAKENGWRCQVQLHKIIWSPDERGV